MNGGALLIDGSTVVTRAAGPEDGEAVRRSGP